MKVDIKTPSSFTTDKGFDAALTSALAKNRERTDVDKLHGLQILSPEVESKARLPKDQQTTTTRILKKHGSMSESKKEEKAKDEEKKELK